MAFGLNIDFGGIIGNLTKGLKSIASAQIQNLSSMVKSSIINTVNSAINFDIQSIIGTSLNLNLSKLTGQLNFSNLLKNIPFPNLSSANLNAVWGAIDSNIGKNLNAFTKNLSKVYKNLNLDEINLTGKINGVVDSQLSNISSEIEAGTIAGKSSLSILGDLNNLSNKQIRDFSINPDLQLDFVNGLVQKQKDKIFDLSFNGVTESSVYSDQVLGLSKTNLDSFASAGSSSLDFSFNSDKIINDITVDSATITNQTSEIKTVVEEKRPVARKVNLNRYNKEEEMLNYLKTFDDEFKVADNTDPVPVTPVQRYVDVIDPDTGEVIGIEDTVQGVIRPV